MVLAGMAPPTGSGDAVMRSLTDTRGTGRGNVDTHQSSRGDATRTSDAPRSPQQQNTTAPGSTAPGEATASQRTDKPSVSATKEVSQRSAEPQRQTPSVSPEQSTTKAGPATSPSATDAAAEAGKPTGGQPASDPLQPLATRSSLSAGAIASSAAATQAASKLAMQAAPVSAAPTTAQPSPVTGVRGVQPAAGTNASAGFKAKLAPPPPRPDGAEAALRAQASRGLALALRSTQSNATIRLDPQHLGTLRVDVVVREGGVEAIFRPSTPEAQRLLQAEHRALEHALAARGLRVEKLEIMPAEEGSSGRHAASDGSTSGHAREGHNGATQHGASGSEHHGAPSQRHAGGAAQRTKGAEHHASTTSAAEHAEPLPHPAEPSAGSALIDTIV